MSVSASGHGSRDKIRTPKIKGLPATPSSNSQNLTVSALKKDDGAQATVDSTKNSLDGKNPPRYIMLLFSNLCIFTVITTCKYNLVFQL